MLLPTSRNTPLNGLPSTNLTYEPNAMNNAILVNQHRPPKRIQTAFLFRALFNGRLGLA